MLQCGSEIQVELRYKVYKWWRLYNRHAIMSEVSYGKTVNSCELLKHYQRNTRSCTVVLSVGQIIKILFQLTFLSQIQLHELQSLLSSWTSSSDKHQVNNVSFVDHFPYYLLLINCYFPRKVTNISSSKEDGPLKFLISVFIFWQQADWYTHIDILASS